MNIEATQSEVDVATQMYQYLSQKVTELGVNPAKVHALLTAGVYTTTDPQIHVDGVEDGKYIYELMQEAGQ